MKILSLFFLKLAFFQKCFSNCLKKSNVHIFYIIPDLMGTDKLHTVDKIRKKTSPKKYANCLEKCFMKRLRNATVEIDIKNKKDLSNVEIIKMFMKGVRDCKNVEYLKERLKGHIPRTTRRKMMKQKRMINLRIHIKNSKIKKAESVPPDKNILNFPKNRLKEINMSVLYFKHYFEKLEKEKEEQRERKWKEAKDAEAKDAETKDAETKDAETNEEAGLVKKKKEKNENK